MKFLKTGEISKINFYSC